MTDLWRLSATQLAKGYASGTFTPVDALDACLHRTVQCAPVLNAMTFMDHAGARRTAEASSRRWREGTPLGPLDGIPITVKDNLHVGGLPTSWGSRLMTGFVAHRDEKPVARLRRAGAVLFGKTNLPEFAMQGYTSNAVFGTTRNPWNPSLTPGGSSGGAAAAVAAGCGPLALATDGGGSIRRPASHCGLVGFKPSARLIPRGGGLPEVCLGFEVVGGIGRNVQDVLHITEILAEKNLEVMPPKSARILFVPQFGSQPVDRRIAAQICQAALQFEIMGHIVTEVRAFDLADEINERWPSLSTVGLAWMFSRASHWPELNLEPDATPDVMLGGEAVRGNLAKGHAVGAKSLFGTFSAIERLKRELDQLFATTDFILSPATAALPWSAEKAHPEFIDGEPVGPRGHAVFTAMANAAGIPGLALPGGPIDGLPNGFQLLGPEGSDAMLLALGRQYESNHPWDDGGLDLIVSRRHYHDIPADRCR